MSCVVQMDSAPQAGPSVHTTQVALASSPLMTVRGYVCDSDLPPADHIALHVKTSLDKCACSGMRAPPLHAA